MLEQVFHHLYYNNFYALGALAVSLMVSYVLKSQVIPNIDSTSTSGWRNKVVADNFKRIVDFFAILLVPIAALRIINAIGTFFLWLIISLVQIIGVVLGVFAVLFLFATLFSVCSSPFTALFVWWSSRSR